MISFLKFLFLFILIYAIISFVRFILAINKNIKENKKEHNFQKNNFQNNNQTNGNKVIELNEDQYKVE